MLFLHISYLLPEWYTVYDRPIGHSKFYEANLAIPAAMSDLAGVGVDKTLGLGSLSRTPMLRMKLSVAFSPLPDISTAPMRASTTSARTLSLTLKICKSISNLSAWSKAHKTSGVSPLSFTIFMPLCKLFEARHYMCLNWVHHAEDLNFKFSICLDSIRVQWLQTTQTSPHPLCNPFRAI